MTHHRLGEGDKMYCRCCKKFHSINFNEVLSELCSDNNRMFYNGLSLYQIDILKNKLMMANIKITNDSIKNIKIIKI